MRRKRQDGALDAAGGRPSSAARKNATVGDGLFDIAVARHDVQDDPGATVCAAEATYSALAAASGRTPRARRVHPAARRGGLQQRAKIERG